MFWPQRLGARALLMAHAHAPATRIHKIIKPSCFEYTNNIYIFSAAALRGAGAAQGTLTIIIL